MTNKAPDTSASTLTPEDGSISGTVTDAMAAPDIPITNSNRPIVFKFTS